MLHLPTHEIPDTRKRVIVLVSSLGVNRTYRPRQNRAISVLKARGYPHEIVDGAQPEQKERRDALFRISGFQSYPQFFLAEKKGTASFLGDFGILEGLHDADNLPLRVLEENPSLVTLKRVLAEAKDLRIVFLSTSLGINPTVTGRQNRATEMLEASGVAFEMVDGSDPSKRKEREKLFKISGRRGVYPQFFIFDPNDLGDEETVDFIGDWEHFEQMNDTEGLPEDTVVAHPNIRTWKSLLGNPPVVEGVGSGSGMIIYGAVVSDKLFDPSNLTWKLPEILALIRQASAWLNNATHSLLCFTRLLQ